MVSYGNFVIIGWVSKSVCVWVVILFLVCVRFGLSEIRFRFCLLGGLIFRLSVIRNGMWLSWWVNIFLRLFLMFGLSIVVRNLRKVVKVCCCRFCVFLIRMCCLFWEEC